MIVVPPIGTIVFLQQQRQRQEEERQRRKTQEQIEKMRLKEIAKRKEENAKRS